MRYEKQSNTQHILINHSYQLDINLLNFISPQTPVSFHTSLKF